jgi:hypothetical protein
VECDPTLVNKGDEDGSTVIKVISAVSLLALGSVVAFYLTKRRYQSRRAKVRQTQCQMSL